jgi:hypothetical protein
VIKFVSDLRQVVASPGTQVFSTILTDCHDIAEILLKVALNTITHKPNLIVTLHNSLDRVISLRHFTYIQLAFKIYKLKVGLLLAK